MLRENSEGLEDNCENENRLKTELTKNEWQQEEGKYYFDNCIIVPETTQLHNAVLIQEIQEILTRSIIVG